MKWTEPDGYSPNKDEFNQLDDYAGRWALDRHEITLKWT